MDLFGIIGIVSGIVGILGAAISLAVFFTKRQAHAEIENQREDHRIEREEHLVEKARLKDRLGGLEKDYSELEANYQELLNSLGENKSIVAFNQKMELGGRISVITQAIKARESAILVPVPPDVRGGEPKNLVFLHISGKAATALRRTKVAIGNSTAGKVFEEKKSRITSDPQQSGFSKRTDSASGFDTKNILAIPLVYRERCVGVAEFLNKEGNASFDASDQKVAEQFIQTLSDMVGELTLDRGNLELLGVIPRLESYEASVLVCDLSNYSSLLLDLEMPDIVNMLSEYFELLWNVAKSHEAVIEKLLGDGFMLTFNVRSSSSQHQSQAVAAALEMQKEFEGLREKWLSLLDADSICSIYNRVGIASGFVYKTDLGPPRHTDNTVVGIPVNIASHLCDLACRDRNVILIGYNVYESVFPQFSIEELEIGASRKKKALVSEVYEVLSRKKKS